MAAVPTPQPLCGGWEGAATALRQAPGDHRRIGYLIVPGRPGDVVGARTEVHVWRDPQPGDRCQCGEQRWE